jgi:hypothetical protein
MELVRCPGCGALSAAGQKLCPQCETRLDLAPVASAGAGRAGEPARVCKQCQHANVFPPVGVKLAHEDIWCTLMNAAQPADAPARDCFELSFAWRREESLD